MDICWFCENVVDEEDRVMWRDEPMHGRCLQEHKRIELCASEQEAIYDPQEPPRTTWWE